MNTYFWTVNWTEKFRTRFEMAQYADSLDFAMCRLVKLVPGKRPVVEFLFGMLHGQAIEEVS